jgi:hypothetical protein
MKKDRTSDGDGRRFLDSFDEPCGLAYRVVTRDPGPEGGRVKTITQYFEALEDFATTFSEGTSDANSFLSLSEIEHLALTLEGRRHALAQELAHEKMGALAEKRPLEKKQELPKEEGTGLRVWRSSPRSVMTLFGPLKYERKALLPKTPDDEAKLYALTSKKTPFPLDEAVGVGVPPFKASVGAILETARRAQEIPSYGAAGGP